MCRSDPVDCAHLMSTVILSYKYSPKTEIPFRAVHACQTSRGASSQMQVCCARKNRAIYDACVHTRTWRAVSRWLRRRGILRLFAGGWELYIMRRTNEKLKREIRIKSKGSGGSSGIEDLRFFRCRGPVFTSLQGCARCVCSKR